MPLQITFRGMTPSEAVERRVRAKAKELERFYGHIRSCHVTIEAPHRHQTQGRLFSVRVDVRLPDNDVIVDRQHHHHHAHEDVYVAIRDAFDAAARQIEDYARRWRGRVKRHEMGLPS